MKSMDSSRFLREESLGDMSVPMAHRGFSARHAPLSSRPHSRLVFGAILTVAFLILLWTILTILVDRLHFVLLTPEAYTGVEAASTLSRFFGALVLLLFPVERLGPRLRWVAGGFIVLGLGGLFFRMVWPLSLDHLSPDHNVYTSIVVWSIAGVMFAVALVPLPITARARRVIVITSASAMVLGTLVFGALGALPSLVDATSAGLADIDADAPLRGLTGWHWALSTIPLLLALLATGGALHFYLRDELGAWLVVAMILLAGSQLHNLFWPAAFSPVLTTADILRFLFGAVVVVGGVVSLWRVAHERQELLAIEQEYSARVSELAALKSNFTAMVAHELHSPLAALRSLSTILRYPEITDEDRTRAFEAIQQQIDLLATLVNDVQDISAIERSSFEVNRRSVPLGRILSDIETYGRTLPGQHPISVHAPHDVQVRADPERIGQVLQNLLNNAAKYSPDGTPIDLRATVRGDTLRIEVEDRGIGIREADLQRIFECFGRGSDPRIATIRGTGLGLYLSRRIVQAHGSDLRVRSQPGEGATFFFDLEIVS